MTPARCHPCARGDGVPGRRWIAARVGTAVLAASLVLAASSHAQALRPSLLIGTVVAADGERTPVRDAVVALDGLPRPVLTDEAGDFVLRGVPPGRHELTVRRWGYVAYHARLAFAGGDTLSQYVELSPHAAELARVTVTAKGTELDTRVAGFERRRRLGIGRFVTRAEIERMAPGGTLAEVMAGMPDVLVQREGTMEVAHAQRGGCEMAVFVDGIRLVPNPVQVPFDLRGFLADVVHGIEIYGGPAETPTEFNPQGVGCGAILVWTRGR